MKFETFKAGAWRQRYQYKSFEPVPVNHEWVWEDATINTLLEADNRALVELACADIERNLPVSSPTANALIRDFEQLGLLQEITGQQRGRAYVFDRYLSLFTS